MIVSIEIVGSKLQVISPFNRLFVKKAPGIGGSWHADSNSWRFDVRNESKVKKLCMEIYGSDGVTENLCDVRVTFREERENWHGPITLFGRDLAAAYGRDSGAKLLNGVVVEEGGFTSGGSAKNWVTRANAETSVIMHDVSRILVDSFENEDIDIEIISEPNDYEKLVAERAELEKRMVDIDHAIALMMNDEMDSEQ